jgi:hypothetical protein
MLNVLNSLFLFKLKLIYLFLETLYNLLIINKLKYPKHLKEI